MSREYREIDGELCIKSPITNEYTAIVEADDRYGESALCTESGYCWSPSYKKEDMPAPIMAQSVEDEQGQLWFPVTVRTTDWIIFRDGNQWTYADIIPSDSEVPGHDHQIDMENKKVFEDFKKVSEYANSQGK